MIGLVPVALGRDHLSEAAQADERASRSLLEAQP